MHTPRTFYCQEYKKLLRDHMISEEFLFCSIFFTLTEDPQNVPSVIYCLNMRQFLWLLPFLLPLQG